MQALTPLRSRAISRRTPSASSEPNRDYYFEPLPQSRMTTAIRSPARTHFFTNTRFVCCVPFGPFTLISTVKDLPSAAITHLRVTC